MTPAAWIPLTECSTAIPDRTGSGLKPEGGGQYLFEPRAFVQHTFPVTTAFWRTAERSNDWSKLNINTLELVLSTHVVSALIDEVAVPGRCNGHTGGESGVEVSWRESVATSRRVLAYGNALSLTPNGESCMHMALKPIRGMAPLFPTQSSPSQLRSH